MKKNLKTTGIETSFVVCRICQRSFRIISGKHLAAHGLTREEYMQKFDLQPDRLTCVDHRISISRRSDYSPFLQSDLRERLRVIHKEHGDVGAEFIAKRWPQIYRQALTFHGKSWTAALEDAGLETWYTKRQREWTKERVISEIHSYYKKHGNLTYNPRLLPKEGFRYSYVVRFFGGWRNAVRAAGYDPMAVGIRDEWSKEKLAAIIRRYASLDEIPKDELRRFQSSCRYYFGSMESALRSEGVNVEKFTGRTKWSKEKVLSKLKQYYCKHGRNCSRLIARHDPNLRSNAFRYFGSWNYALQQAGINPIKIEWTRALVVKELRGLLRNGARPTLASYTQRKNMKLYTAAVAQFGSWEKAILASKMVFRPAQETWCEARVLSEIARHQLGEKSTLGRKHHKLYRASLRYFGSWKKAVMATSTP